MSEQKKLDFGEPLRFRFPEHPWTKNHHNGNPVNPLQKSQIWAANGSRFHTSKRNRKAKSREGHRFVVWMYCLHWFTATKKLLLQYFRIVIWVHIIPYTPSIVHGMDIYRHVCCSISGASTTFQAQTSKLGERRHSAIHEKIRFPRFLC